MELRNTLLPYMEFRNYVLFLMCHIWSYVKSLIETTSRVHLFERKRVMKSKVEISDLNNGISGTSFDGTFTVKVPPSGRQKRLVG